MTFDAGAGASLPDGSTCTHPLVIDPMTYLVGCDEDGSQGIFRTTNAGTSWTLVSPMSGGQPLGGSDAPLVWHDQSIYWSTAGGKGIVHSTDQGVSWTTVTPSGCALGTRLIELPDQKRIAAIGPVQGSTQTVIVSSDGGATWAPASAALPFQSPQANPQGLTYSKYQKAFFVWHAPCQDTVPPDAIQRFDWDYTTQ
jgi:photosystem II stability/assembly factor-like uncharacterized protein